MSDTPRTDGHAFEITVPGADRPGVVQTVVPYDIAQQLERELADLKHSIASLSHPNFIDLLSQLDEVKKSRAGWQGVAAKHAGDVDSLTNRISEVTAQRDRLADIAKRILDLDRCGVPFVLNPHEIEELESALAYRKEGA